MSVALVDSQRQNIKIMTRSVGFEPTRENPNRFLVCRLNHSAMTASLAMFRKTRIRANVLQINFVGMGLIVGWDDGWRVLSHILFNYYGGP